MGDESEDREMDSFVDAARAAIAFADPVPDAVTALAKLAFEFRTVETIDSTSTNELAGVRSGGSSAGQQVSRGSTTLLWTRAEGRLTGVIHSSQSVVLTIETLNQSIDTILDPEGAFESAAPDGAYRLVVAQGNDTWGTPWTS